MNGLLIFLSKNRHTISVWGLGILLFILVNWLSESLLNMQLSNTSAALTKSFLLSIGFGALAWFSVKKANSKSEFLGICSLKNNSLFFLFGMGLLLGPLVVTLSLSALLGWASYQFNPDMATVKQQLITLIVVFLFEAFPEEILFRGSLFGNFRENYSKKEAAVLTTILFVLFPIVAIPIQSVILQGPNIVGGNEGITAGYLVYMLVFGFITVFLRILTGSLWTSMGFHLVFVFMNHLIGIGNNSLILIIDYSNELSIQVILLVCILTVLVVVVRYSRKKAKRWRAKEGLLSGSNIV